MPLAPGTRLGSYEVVNLLGSGGMGEVYRARDTKLDRDVALKILPDVFAGDADRLARFEREAKTLALLNHTNIAHVYDAGKSDAGAYLVMELVDGQDLSEIILGHGRSAPAAAAPSESASRGVAASESLQPAAPGVGPRRIDGSRAPRALGIDDAIAIARQLIDALEAAHESGIVHRDLKPANVKVRTDGTVKVLDFGLAKAMEPAGVSSDNAMNSPTLTARATQMGMIIGTAAYMAPEQARGRAVDRRADIWAFGVVLYEMLAGKRAFEGEDISITLAGVLKEDVRWDALPADLPAPVVRLLRRCLEKDPKRRLGWIGEARVMLEDSASSDTATQLTTAPAPSIAPFWRRALPWGAALASAAAAVVFLFMWAPWRTDPAPPTPRKLLSSIGADALVASLTGPSVILSPDGTTLAFVGAQAGVPRIFVRKLEELQATPLVGTEGAANPFFSPRGESIAYFAGGKLKKVSVTGGASIPLCDAVNSRGGTWTDDDTIIFTPTSGPNTVLLSVPAAGGTPVPFGVLSQNATSQRWPQALPRGKGVLYSENASIGEWDGANVVVAPVSGGAAKVVVRGGYFGRYVSSGLASPKRGEREGGHLLYMQQGTVFAVAFDLDRLEPIGQPVNVLDGVEAVSNTGFVQIAVASDGTLVYVPGSALTVANPVDWITRDGKTSVLRAAKADWVNPKFSPDGQKLALEINDGRQRDVWIHEWATDRMTQLTLDPAVDRHPVWTLDGRRIVFASDRGTAGIMNLYLANADGSGSVTRLTDSPESQLPFSWHPSGKFLTYQRTVKDTGIDLMILPMAGDDASGWKAGTPTEFRATPATEIFPVFSPDGKWLSYFSNEVGGTFEIFVRPFPGPGGTWKVSDQGGNFARWSATSDELLFVSQGQVMVAPYTVVGDAFRADKPRAWSPTRYVPLGLSIPYDIHPDGKRLAIVAAPDQGNVVRDKVVFVFNFFDHLRKIAPAKK